MVACHGGESITPIYAVNGLAQPHSTPSQRGHSTPITDTRYSMMMRVSE